MNAPDRLLDSADTILKHFGDQAREYIRERLYGGKTVRRLTLRDLLHDELAGPRCEFASIEVVNLMLSDSGERASRADAFVEGVVERFIESNDDLVLEYAEEIAAEECA